MTKKEKRPIGDDKRFLEACKVVLAMYSTATADTKRCFIGGCADHSDDCLIFFRGDVDDIFAVKEFLEKRNNDF